MVKSGRRVPDDSACAGGRTFAATYVANDPSSVRHTSKQSPMTAASFLLMPSCFTQYLRELYYTLLSSGVKAVSKLFLRFSSIKSVYTAHIGIY